MWVQLIYKASDGNSFLHEKPIQYVERWEVREACQRRPHGAVAGDRVERALGQGRDVPRTQEPLYAPLSISFAVSFCLSFTNYRCARSYISSPHLISVHTKFGKRKALNFKTITFCYSSIQREFKQIKQLCKNYSVEFMYCRYLITTWCFINAHPFLSTLKSPLRNYTSNVLNLYCIGFCKNRIRKNYRIWFQCCSQVNNQICSSLNCIH